MHRQCTCTKCAARKVPGADTRVTDNGAYKFRYTNRAILYVCGDRIYELYAHAHIYLLHVHMVIYHIVTSTESSAQCRLSRVSVTRERSEGVRQRRPKVASLRVRRTERRRSERRW